LAVIVKGFSLLFLTNPAKIEFSHTPFAFKGSTMFKRLRLRFPLVIRLAHEEDLRVELAKVHAELAVANGKLSAMEERLALMETRMDNVLELLAESRESKHYELALVA
jgi:hypothetical protein